MGGIIGGSSEQESQSQAYGQSGFSQLPKELQDVWKLYGTQLSEQFGDDQSAAFTPTPLTEGEQAALGSMTEGYRPTEESLSSDIAMQMNPYNQYVIEGINREAGREMSGLQSQLASAGQFGSNRALIGASDIDLAREQQIGNFLQNQYNQSLQNALTTMPALSQASDQAALQAGGYGRGLEMQRRQAPISALQSFGQLLGVVPQSGGSIQQSGSQSFGTSGSGLFGLTDQRLALLSRGKM